MDVRSLDFRTDLALLALAGSEVEDRGDLVVVRTPANPAFHWGNFVLLQRPPTTGEVPGLLAAYDAEFSEGRHRSIGIDGSSDQRGSLGPLADDDGTRQLALSTTANDDASSDLLPFARATSASDRARSETGPGGWWGVRQLMSRVD